MNLGISFAPLVPSYVVWAAFAVAALISIALLLARSRGAPLRALALALMVLTLANPSLTREDRDPIPSVAAVIVDKSPSQSFGDRAQQTEATRAALVERLKRIPGLEVRVAEAGAADGETDGTKLFAALSSTLADVPPDRVAGAVLITDGRVHDVPADASTLGFSAPLHALITGHKDEIDRRVVLTQTPRFGIVGQSQTVGFRVEDQGAKIGAVEVTVRRDGEVLSKRVVTVHTDIKFNVPIPHAGPNIVEIEASPLEGELTPVNNRAVVSIDGVRDKLRVLLVSGEPHAGERTWRNLLKSDASVDLVHFTILRPPEKQDGTPINELSLIAFPTRELFQQKINEFQLIIFDRYARQGVLPIIYFDNIARYVRGGGAVLVAAGPDYASQTSIWRTPLDDELTTVNNRAVVSIEGVRDKLRVLLVSGEPHAGERAWRNLLKSDAAVDLVHFTILRPPEKQDGTPIHELSLIAFPTRELFQQKIHEFQLIIFDRYARQGVLPILYFDNIARYVRGGGAVLIAAGPDYASQTSLWRTPLESVLPAEPSGRTTDMAYRAEL